MSSGSLHLNQFYLLDESNSNSWVGFKYNRSWSGADAPKRKRAPRIPMEVQCYSRKRGFFKKTIYIRDPNAAEPAARKYEEHAYSKTITDYNSAPIVWRPIGWNSDRTDASFGYCVNGSWTDFSAMDSRANLRAQSKLRSTIADSDFNAGVALGEMAETLRLVESSAIRVAKSVWHLRQGDWSGAVLSLFEGSGRAPIKHHLSHRPRRKVVRHAADMWLELQYGWLPLLSDVKSAAESYAAWRQKPIRFSVRFGAEELEVVKQYYDLPPLGRVYGQSIKAVQRHYKVTLKENPSKAYRLGLTDPLSVAWELVPFSFVADWFMPIGQFLEASSACNTLKVESVVSTFKWTADMSVPFTRASRYMQFTRSVSTGWPSPPLPRFKPLSKAASVLHCANALALLSTVFTGGDSLTPRAFNPR